MANWYGSARSNYFQVKDEKAFREWATTLPNCEAVKSDLEGKGWCLLARSEDGGWPSDRYNEEEDDYVGLDLAAELAEHLAEGQVAVLMQIGAEKLRYVTGIAFAVSWTGETVEVSLEDIYKKANDAFGVTPSYATY